MNEKIGERIAKLRSLSGMTQTELADCVYISRASVESWENGSNYPSADNIICLAELFHVTSDYLLNLSPHRTLVLDRYTKEQQELIFSMLRHFDEVADMRVEL